MTWMQAQTFNVYAHVETSERQQFHGAADVSSHLSSINHLMSTRTKLSKSKQWRAPLLQTQSLIVEAMMYGTGSEALVQEVLLR